ncbi:MAG: hypothetical protein A2075_01090 [Geobacteraceae bacterium GWC2_58_44]|nr:MAG: hypothetical protein A2075_01090 [Geobacteraceae bacterium GWC2_58_44]HBG04777.1 hypothetical protein [Geobacter sp.]
MLALDSTIGCIEASESEVVDLYRSLPVIMSSAAGSKPSSMEAYVCAIRRKAGVKVYLALVADNRRIYVYTEPGKFDSEEESKETVQEAIAFARSMGFSPEPVALSYSPAMREVVVRNMKILRPPGSKVRALLKHGTADAPTPTGVKGPNAAQKKPAATSPTAPATITPAIPAAPPTLAAAPVAASILKQATTPELSDVSKEVSAARAISDLKRGLKQVATEKDAQFAQIQQLSELHQIALAELAGARKECARLAAERDELAQCKKQLEAATERDAAADQLRELSALHLAATTELAGAKEECARLTTERDELAQSKKQLEQAATERDAAAEQLRELSALHQSATTVLVSARDECARLTEERDALAHCKIQFEAVATERNAVSDQLRELSARHQTAATELASAREHCVRLEEERDALKRSARGTKQASSDLAALQKEVAALSRQIEEANRSNVKLAAESTALAETAARADEEAKTLAAERDAALKRMEHLRAENRTASSQNEAKRTELATSCAEKEAALLRIEVLEQQKVATESELGALRREVAVLAGEREMLREKSKELESRELQNRDLENKNEKKSREIEKNRELERSREPGKSRDSSRLAAATIDADQSAVAVLESAEPRLTHEPVAAPDLGTYAKKVEQRYLSPEFHDFDSAAQSGEDATTGTAAQAMEFTPLADLHDFFSPGSDDHVSPVRFLLQAELTAIEYLCPDDVVELHQSINNAYLSPDGKGQESCRGYICGLRKGASVQVFAAISGVQSGRTSVYVPEVQPEDDHSYTTTVRGAISFAEEVGFMMEPIKLDVSSLQQHESLVRCPALRSAEQK